MNRPQGVDWWRASDGSWYPPESLLLPPPPQPQIPPRWLKTLAVAGCALIAISWVAYFAIVAGVDLPTTERRYAVQKMSDEAFIFFAITMLSTGGSGLAIVGVARARISRRGWTTGHTLTKAGLIAGLVGIAATIGLVFAAGNT